MPNAPTRRLPVLIASVWFLILTFYFFLYDINPGLAIFAPRNTAVITGAGFFLFGVTYLVLQKRNRTRP